MASTRSPLDNPSKGTARVHLPKVVARVLYPAVSLESNNPRCDASRHVSGGTEVEITMILCEYAQAAEGKLTIVGGGWSMRSAEPSPMGIGVLVELPSDAAINAHAFCIRLRDTDGNTVSDPNGQPIRIEGGFDATRMPGTPPNVPLVVPLAINIAGLALPPGQRYVWELTFDGNDEAVWQVAFNTAPPQLRATG